MLSASTIHELRDQVALGAAAADLLAAYGLAPETPAPRTRAITSAPQGPTRAELKEWGAQHGVHISDRGRIAAGVLAQYAASQVPALTVGEGAVASEPDQEEVTDGVLMPAFTPPRSTRPSQGRRASKAA